MIIIYLLPTIVTCWEKQLSLQNERVQIKIIRKTFESKTTKSCLSIGNNYNTFQFQTTVIFKETKTDDNLNKREPRC